MSSRFLSNISSLYRERHAAHTYLTSSVMLQRRYIYICTWIKSVVIENANIYTRNRHRPSMTNDEWPMTSRFPNTTQHTRICDSYTGHSQTSGDFNHVIYRVGGKRKSLWLFIRVCIYHLTVCRNDEIKSVQMQRIVCGHLICIYIEKIAIYYKYSSKE